MTDPLRSSATISDLEWVQAIVDLREPMRSGGYRPVTIWDLADRLDIHPNRVRSKARRAWRRKLSRGCTCGCRGDFELLPAGEELAGLRPSLASVLLRSVEQCPMTEAHGAHFGIRFTFSTESEPASRQRIFCPGHI